MPNGWLVRPSSVHSHEGQNDLPRAGRITTVPQIGRTKPRLLGNSEAIIGGKVWAKPLAHLALICPITTASIGMAAPACPCVG